MQGVDSRGVTRCKFWSCRVSFDPVDCVVGFINRLRYHSYVKCLGDADGDGSQCKKQRYLAHASCPVAWLAEWKEQREEGTFAGIVAPVEEDDDE